MPTYEYVCEKCDHQFEKFQPIADKALAVCPKENCGQRKWGRGKVRRLIGGGAGLLFKGSGFYITDYRSEGYKAAAKKEASPPSGDAKTPSTPAKTDTKKAAAPAATKPSGSS
jgi:putative FmdB family regulatory protein